MYQISKLKVIAGVIHGISDISDGDMSFNFQERGKTVNNMKVFLEKIGVNINNCVSMNVEHSDKVVIVGGKDYKKGIFHWKSGIICDAMLTNKKNLYLFLKTADCAPVVLYDDTKNVLGLIHIGWKNVELKIIEKVIKTCKNVYGSACKNIQILIGPCARKQSYIKLNPSQINNIRWKKYLHKININSYQVDFLGYFIDQLSDLGISKSNIYDCKIDTIKNKRFYSNYRYLVNKTEIQGRFASVVGLIGQ